MFDSGGVPCRSTVPRTIGRSGLIENLMILGLVVPTYLRHRRGSFSLDVACRKYLANKISVENDKSKMMRKNQKRFS
jgi:hypothetical protein